MPKCHGKTLSGPGDVKFFCPGRRMYMYTLLLLKDAVFSEERQLIKWVENSGWKLCRWEFSRR